jgi:hypothetical protein
LSNFARLQAFIREAKCGRIGQLSKAECRPIFGPEKRSTGKPPAEMEKPSIYRQVHMKNGRLPQLATARLGGSVKIGVIRYRTPKWNAWRSESAPRVHAPLGRIGDRNTFEIPRFAEAVLFDRMDRSEKAWHSPYRLNGHLIQQTSLEPFPGFLGNLPTAVVMILVAVGAEFAFANFFHQPFLFYGRAKRVMIFHGNLQTRLAPSLERFET